MAPEDQNPQQEPPQPPSPPDSPQPPRINPSAAEQRSQQPRPSRESQFQRKVIDTSKDARRGR
jgi:hypothetical protein